MVGVFKTRRALLEDLDFVLGELKDFSDFFESELKLFGSNEDYNRKLISHFIEKYLFIICEKEGHGPIGFITGVVNPHFLNPEIICLTELFWWVRPEYRTCRAGYLLLKEFIEYGKENCDWTVMTIESNSPVRAESLLRHGFKHKETSFIMEN